MTFPGATVRRICECRGRMPSPERTSAEVRITGRVQGVWFRAWTRDAAERLGLAGWVRNEPDGSVRALFVGAPAAVAQMLARCRDGPPAARVVEVASRPVDPPPTTAGFTIRR